MYWLFHPAILRRSLRLGGLGMLPGPHPGREGRREQTGSDAVHQKRQPPPGRHAVMIGRIAAQHRKVLFAHSAITS